MSDQVLPQPSALCGQDASHSLQPTQMRVHGVELHYIEAGRGEPLILLIGGQGDYRSWGPQLQALSPHYRVISYSRRYHYPNNNPLTYRIIQPMLKQRTLPHLSVSSSSNVSILSGHPSAHSRR